MKKMILLATIVAAMVSCTSAPEPTQCELFGVRLGMTKDDALAVINDRFGRPDEQYGVPVLENIYSDGVKYETVMFWFSDCDVLAAITADLPDIENFYPHPDTARKTIERLNNELHRVDSSLMLKHKVYNTPNFSLANSGEYLQTIAAKDLHNTDDYITVSVVDYEYTENSYGIKIVLQSTEKFKYFRDK